MFELVETELDQQANIKAIGIGGGGGNTIAHLLKHGHQDDDIGLLMANTDQQALRDAGKHALVLGESVTRGLGAGARPEVGQKAAQEAEASIRERLCGTDMLFITAGMGGGTGTGAAPVIAEIAGDMGILTVAIVTRPFSFEGARRRNIADAGIKALAGSVDALITVPNDKLLAVMGKNASMLTAFEAVNDVLRDAVLGISGMITAPGMINVDFADVRTVMSCHGMAKIGTGRALGEARAEQAALDAINSPLLDDVDVSGAAGLLVNITAGPDLTIGEFNVVGEALQGFVGDDATVVIGTSLDMERSEEILVSVVATGLAPGNKPAAEPAVSTTPSRHESPAVSDRRHTPATVKQTAVAPVAAEVAGHPGPRRQPSGQRPALARQQSRHADRDGADEDYLDIPAFLRRPAAVR